MALETEIIF